MATPSQAGTPTVSGGSTVMSRKTRRWTDFWERRDLRDYIFVSLKNNLYTVSFCEFIWRLAKDREMGLGLQRGHRRAALNGQLSPPISSALTPTTSAATFMKSPKLHTSKLTHCHIFFQFRNLWLPLILIPVLPSELLLWLQNYSS